MMYYVCICMWVCSYTSKEQIHAFNWHQSHSDPIRLPGHPCLVTARIMRGPGCFCSHEDLLPSITVLSGCLWHAPGLSALCLLTPRPLLSPCHRGWAALLAKVWKLGASVSSPARMVKAEAEDRVPVHCSQERHTSSTLHWIAARPSCPCPPKVPFQRLTLLQKTR